MDALLLGGNSQRNREWINKVGSEVGDLFDQTLVHDYRHWSDGIDMVDIPYELEAIKKEVERLGDFVVFAKSVGSLMGLMLLADGSLRPTACVFAGLAIKLAEEDGIDVGGLLSKVSVPITFIQNTNDPVASFEKMKELVTNSGVPDARFVETPGDDHSYDDLGLIRDLLRGL